MGVNGDVIEVVPARWLQAERPCGGYSIGIEPPLSEEQLRFISIAPDVSRSLGHTVFHEGSLADGRSAYTEIAVNTRDLKPDLIEGDYRDRYGRLYCHEADQRTIITAKLVAHILTIITDKTTLVHEGMRNIGYGNDHFYTPPVDRKPLSVLALTNAI